MLMVVMGGGGGGGGELYDILWFFYFFYYTVFGVEMVPAAWIVHSCFTCRVVVLGSRALPRVASVD